MGKATQIDLSKIDTHKQPKRMLHNLVGEKIGRLAVNEYYGISDKKQIYWKCVCECGNEIIVKTADLTAGVRKSCGCLQMESGKANYKYGCRTNRLYRIWRGMKARCLNKNSPNYCSYGSKGISICEEWVHDFTKFQSWALANGYSDELSIDRINVNGNYEPANCRWATIKEQANNKTNNVYITENGKTQTLAEWCEEFNANRDKVKCYMNRYPFLEALRKGVKSAGSR